MPTGEHSLELDRDREFNRREWRVQRFAWGLWVALVAAALAGLLGAGPLSSTSRSSDDGEVRLSYNRFVHYHSPESLEVTLQLTSDDTVQLKLAQEFLSRVQIERIHPEPIRSELADDGVVFVFARSPGASGSLHIVFHLQYERYGMAEGTIEHLGHGAVAFQQWVYP